MNLYRQVAFRHFPEFAGNVLHVFLYARHDTDTHDKYDDTGKRRQPCRHSLDILRLAGNDLHGNEGAHGHVGLTAPAVNKQVVRSVMGYLHGTCHVFTADGVKKVLPVENGFPAVTHRTGKHFPSASVYDADDASLPQIQLVNKGFQLRFFHVDNHAAVV